MKENSNVSNDFKKSFFKNVLISGGYNYVSQILTFLSSIVIARLLSPSNYGLVGLITVFTGFISVFSDSGVSLAVIKSDFKYTYHKSLDTLSFYLGVLLFIITSILAFPIAYFYGNSSLLYPTLALASTFVFKSVSIVRGAILAKELNFNYIGRVVLGTNFLVISLTIVLAYLGAQHWAIIIPQIVSSLFTFVLYERKVKLGIDLYALKYLKVAFSYTRKTIGNLIGFNLVNYWARNSDNLIVGKVYGISELGIYNRAYSLLTLPLTLISGLMGTVLFPSLKKLKSEDGDVFQEYQFILKVIEFIVFPISCVFILFPETLVGVLWGAKWLQVSVLLPYFGLLVFSQSLLSTSGNILVLQGKERILLISGWVGSIFIISGIALGSYFSLVAIAQLYSLTYILLILPFNTIYVYCYGLGFEKKIVYKFWIPIILISLLLWYSCYKGDTYLKVLFLVFLLANMLISSKNELKNVIKVMRSKFSN